MVDPATLTEKERNSLAELITEGVRRIYSDAMRDKWTFRFDFAFEGVCARYNIRSNDELKSEVGRRFHPGAPAGDKPFRRGTTNEEWLTDYEKGERTSSSKKRDKSK